MAECWQCDGTGKVPGLGGYIVGKFGTVMGECSVCGGTGELPDEGDGEHPPTDCPNCATPRDRLRVVTDELERTTTALSLSRNRVKLAEGRHEVAQQENAALREQVERLTLALRDINDVSGRTGESACVMGEIAVEALSTTPTAPTDAAQAERLTDLVAGIRRIADDYYPDRPEDAALALSEMREALLGLIADNGAPPTDAAQQVYIGTDTAGNIRVARDDGGSAAETSTIPPTASAVFLRAPVTVRVQAANGETVTFVVTEIDGGLNVKACGDGNARMEVLRADGDMSIRPPTDAAQQPPYAGWTDGEIELPCHTCGERIIKAHLSGGYVVRQDPCPTCKPPTGAAACPECGGALRRSHRIGGHNKHLMYCPTCQPQRKEGEHA